jgi:hypothetical protein
VRENEPATVDDYNELGCAITEDEIAAVEAAVLEWRPPEE